MGAFGGGAGDGVAAAYRQGDTSIGLGLFLSGVMLALAGLLLFAWGELGATGQGVWRLREYAGIAAAIGLPLALVGMQAVLSDHARTLVGLVGAVVCILDTVAFSVAYPGDWNVRSSPDYVLEVVAVYCLGLFLLFASLWLAVRTVTEAVDTGKRIDDPNPELDSTPGDPPGLIALAVDASEFQWGTRGTGAETDGGVQWERLTAEADPAEESGFEWSGSEGRDESGFEWLDDDTDPFAAESETDEDPFEWGTLGGDAD